MQFEYLVSTKSLVFKLSLNSAENNSINILLLLEETYRQLVACKYEKKMM